MVRNVLRQVVPEPNFDRPMGNSRTYNKILVKVREIISNVAVEEPDEFMVKYAIECLVANSDHLGEGPIWDIEEAALYWVDGTGRRIGQPSIWRLDPATGKTISWSLKRDIGAIALRSKGGAILAMEDGFYTFDFATGEINLIKKINAGKSRLRLNDGKCDRHGRFFAGQMDDNEALAECSLWRLDPDHTVTKVEDRIICSNGPCWSPDNKTFYFSDTFQHLMWAYDYDIGTGTLSNKRIFTSAKGERGVFDGSTVDAEGYVWNAQVIGGELIRYAPDGTENMRIGMPVRNVTSLCFGGPNLDDIYVTSMARVTHSATHEYFKIEPRAQFGAGSLFRVRGLGIRGLPEPRFGG